jgi:putative ABC transport system permease protein
VEIIPVIRALEHRKTGVALIALQIALSVAILANSLSVVQQRQWLMRRPSGLDEANIFSMTNQFAGPVADLSARIQADLAQLRAIHGVVDATAVQSFPLRGYGASTGVTVRPDEKYSALNAAEYSMPPNGLHTWGLRLISGRNFKAEEVRDFQIGVDEGPASAAIVSQALADRLFAHGNALGQNIYLGTTAPTRIVGIVERVQTPWAAQSNGSGPFGAEESVLVSRQWVSPIFAYVVRTAPGRADALLAVAQQRLFALSRARIISSAQTFAETRAEQYRSDRALGLVLAVVCALLLAVTAFGVVALTTYWVSQRQRQIGMRRALGARRANIVQYFHLENLLIAGVGAVTGVLLAQAGNLWLANSLEIARVRVDYLCLGAFIVVALSQAAVVWPALRAASLPPAAAIRGR